jgi:2-oxoglutarate ferredoxin oxidoreductase subunit beta
MDTTGKFDFVPMKEEITASYPPGSTREVTMHDGSTVHLYKMSHGIDPLDRYSAMRGVQEYKAKGQVLTGLIYMDPDSQDMHKMIETCSKPLNKLGEADLCPGNRVLQDINDSLR